jgi:hypothetical protein
MGANGLEAMRIVTCKKVNLSKSCYASSRETRDSNKESINSFKSSCYCRVLCILLPIVLPSLFLKYIF